MSETIIQLTGQLISLCLDPAGSKLRVREGSWEVLVSLALYHGIAPLLWWELKDRDLPAEVRAQLKTLYTANLIRNQELKTEQERVLAAPVFS